MSIAIQVIAFKRRGAGPGPLDHVLITQGENHREAFMIGCKSRSAINEQLPGQLRPYVGFDRGSASKDLRGVVSQLWREI